MIFKTKDKADSQMISQDFQVETVPNINFEIQLEKIPAL